MADEARARRMAGRIKQIVARGLESQVKDPRLGMVTVTDVRVTGDLHDATVFYTVWGDDAERADSAVALESVKGRLRSEVGRQTGVKFTPSLTFVLDAVPDAAREVDELLAKANRADAELAKVREGATYAGEADPYKAPRVREDGDDDAPDHRVPPSWNAVDARAAWDDDADSRASWDAEDAADRDGDHAGR